MARAPAAAPVVRRHDVWPLVAIVGAAALVHSYVGLWDPDAPRELVVLVGAALFAATAAWRRFSAWRAAAPDERTTRVPPGPLLALAFLVLILVAATRALDAHAAIRRAGLWTAGIVLLLEARARLSSDHAARRAALGLAGVGAVVALWGLGQAFFGGLLGRPGVFPEPVSTLGNTSFAAGFVVILAPLAAALALDRGLGRAVRRGCAIAAVLIVALVLVTKSRTDYVALGAAVLAAGVLRARSRRAVVTWATVAALAVAGLVVLVQTPWIGRSDTIRVRELVWTSSVPLALENPAAGIGLTDFPAEFPPRRDPEEYEISLRHDVETPHCDPLEIAIEAGIPALLLWLALLGLAIAAGRRPDGDPDASREDGTMRVGFATAVVAGLVSGLANSPLAHPAHLALLALVVGGALAGGARRRGIALPTWTAPAAGVLAAVVLLVPGWFSYRHLEAARALGAADLEPKPDVQDELAVRALEAEPHNVDAAVVHGKWLLAHPTVENARRAHEVFRRVREVRPNETRILVCEARLESLLGRHGIATRLLGRALEINPREDAAYQLLQRVGIEIAFEALRDGDVETATEKLEPAVSHLVERGWTNMARRGVSFVASRVPDGGPKLIDRLAIEADAGGRPELARVLTEGLAASGRAGGDTWTRLAKAAAARGESERSAFYTSRAKLAYAYEYALRGDAETAQRQLTRAERLGVPASEAIMVRAILAVKREQLGDALRLVQAAVANGFADVDRLDAWAADVFDPISGNHPKWRAIMEGAYANERRIEGNEPGARR